MQLPLQKILRNGMTVELDYMYPQEEEVVRSLLNIAISEGKTYPQNHPLSGGEFAAYWLPGDSFVVRKAGDGDKHKPAGVLGAFYIKPNFPGRCSHICNAGFIVQPEMRGEGIGRFMGESMLEIAAALGYEAVMFNLVFATNIPSIRLWQSLGFQTIGRIEQAAKLTNTEAVDALIMYRGLK